MRNARSPFAACFRLKLLDGLKRSRLQPRADIVSIFDNGLAHPRIPELLQVIGHIGNRLVLALVSKEFTDPIGHIHELVRRQVRTSAGRYVAGE